MTNNILEMKKHQHNIGRPSKTLGAEFEYFPESKADRVDALFMKDETKDFNRFMWRYLGYIFIFVFGLGMGLWVADVYACGDESFESERIEIKVNF